MIVGSRFQMEINGGPQPSKDFAFVLSQSDVLRVHDSAQIIEAVALGSVKLTVQMLLRSDSEQNSTLCQVFSTGFFKERKASLKDSAVVNVVQLAGVRVNAPITRILVGEEMPVFVSGTANESPFIFGSLLHQMRFVWSLENVDGDTDVARLESVASEVFLGPFATMQEEELVGVALRRWHVPETLRREAQRPRIDPRSGSARPFPEGKAVQSERATLARGADRGAPLRAATMNRLLFRFWTRSRSCPLRGAARGAS